MTIKKFLQDTKPNILHLNSTKASLLGAVAAKMSRHKPKVIFTIHGLPQMEDRNWLVKNILRFVTLYTAKLSDKVICVSALDFKEMQRYKFLKNSLTYIPNAIPALDFYSSNTAKNILQTNYNVPIMQNTRIIGSIAELTDNKGIIEFLPKLQQVLNKHPNTIYVHFGDGPLKKEILTKVHQLNLSDKIYFLGFVKDAYKFLKALDIFVLPSKKEGMPFVLLEAGQANSWVWAKPAIATLHMLSQNCKQILGFHACRVKKEFNFDTMISKTAQIYEK